MSYFRLFFTVRDQNNVEKAKELNVGDDSNPSDYETATTVYAELIKDPNIISTTDKILKIN